MTLRQYIPPIGKSIKMREWVDYTSRDVHVWAWLRVTAINSDGVVAQVLNGTSPTSQFVSIPFSAIAPPIGWQPRYTIYVSPDKVETVLSWFSRGIVVRQSHDMSGSMPTAFQPMDNSGQSHWQFCEVTDAVQAEDCAKVFRVVRFERENVYDVYLVPDTACEHCHGTGRDSLARVNRYRAERGMSPCDEETVSHLGSRPGWDAETKTFECMCVRGGFSKLGRTKRAKVIKEWAKDGWKTEYVNHGEHSWWERTRETVVQDWEA